MVIVRLALSDPANAARFAVYPTCYDWHTSVERVLAVEGSPRGCRRKQRRGQLELVDRRAKREGLDLLWPASPRAGEEASRSARCPTGFLDRAVLFAGLALLAGFARAFRLRRLRRRLSGAIDCVLAHKVSP